MKLMVVLDEAAACPCSLQCLRKLDDEAKDHVTLVTVAEPAHRRTEGAKATPRRDWPSQSPVPKPATLEFLDEAIRRVRADAQAEAERVSGRHPQIGMTSRVVSHSSSDAAIAALYEDGKPEVTILCAEKRPLRGRRWRKLTERIRKAGGLVIECQPAK